ncbi:MAG: aminopeptidase P family protein [Algoriphagus sp.]|uniref:aminopeptidase P family protein n=1 Tax=Algoriphagus sp. TaxID=1872435 RepID=UPI00272EF3F2|nr:aminopeptidase P family protein [Algoriphagus sp.]MDP2039992.1 aminopeptidase P family protein [Algoriphagus sp.]MDP3473669.1 aminopeptidase P family protein [Algoriphagus sp.]
MNTFPKETYIERRNQLKKKMGSGLLLFLGNEESSVNFKDNWYPFRQDSTFLYFFGLNMPGLAAVIDIDRDAEIIFGDNLTVVETIWQGSHPPLSDLAMNVGVGITRPKNEIEHFLASAVNQRIHFLPPYRPENSQKLAEWLKKSLAEIQSQASVDFIKAVVSLRSIKSKEEIQELTKAVNISVSMHKKLMLEAKPGMKEYELLGLVAGQALSLGGSVSFPPIITIDGQILHNHNYSNTLVEGKMLLGDFGAESGMHYAGDITRTSPVGSKFTDSQREVYQIVLHAYHVAVAALKPGIRFKEVHLLACRKLAEGLKDLGLMKGNLDDAVGQGAHALFFQCGLGHMMGLDVHDMEDLGEEYVGYTEELKKSTQFGLKSLRLGRELEKGFVLTIEPGLYFIPQLIDQWQAKKLHSEYIDYERVAHYRDFGGIRVEDAYVITETGSMLLGDPLEIEIKAVEGVRNGKSSF